MFERKYHTESSYVYPENTHLSIILILYVLINIHMVYILLAVLSLTCATANSSDDIHWCSVHIFPCTWFLLMMAQKGQNMYEIICNSYVCL